MVNNVVYIGQGCQPVRQHNREGCSMRNDVEQENGRHSEEVGWLQPGDTAEVVPFERYGFAVIDVVMCKRKTRIKPLSTKKSSTPRSPLMNRVLSKPEPVSVAGMPDLAAK